MRRSVRAALKAAATIWTCQICRFSDYDLANKAAILLPAEPHACPDCGGGSCPCGSFHG